MSRYLARLLQRAAGAEPNAAVPPTPPRPTQSESQDPFEATAPSDLTPLISATPMSQPRTTDTPTLAHPEPAEAASLVASPTNLTLTPAPLVALPDLLAPMAFTPAKPVSVSETAQDLKPAYPPGSTETLRESVEHTHTERELLRESIETIHTKEAAPLLPPAPKQQVPAPVEGNATKTERRPQLEPVAAAPRLSPREPMAHQKPAGTAPSEASRSIPERPEPRLVIGSMRVEVVPVSAPVATPQTRIVRSTRSGPSGPPTGSQLQFGLGQM